MWIKICGIRDVTTARQVAALAPDAIGLNFHPSSPRYVDQTQAATIVAELHGQVEPVGVFVEHAADEVIDTCRECGIRTAQLHGDQDEHDVQRCLEAGLNVIRVLRIGVSWPEEWTIRLERMQYIQGKPAMRCLVDAYVEGTPGGTGQVVPWKLIRDRWQPGWPPLILAGGLTPENVQEAIRTVCPYGVDVAGGVERVRGEKDFARVRAFVEQARLPVG